MKQNLPMPVVIGVVVVVLAVVTLFFLRSVSTEPHTPRPDRSRFLKPNDYQPPRS